MCMTLLEEDRIELEEGKYRLCGTCKTVFDVDYDIDLDLPFKEHCPICGDKLLWDFGLVMYDYPMFERILSNKY